MRSDARKRHTAAREEGCGAEGGIVSGEERAPANLGAISLWPGGYAMTLGYDYSGNSCVRCCGGHETPRAAQEHGIVRALEVVQARSATDVAAWTATDGEPTS